MNYLKFHLGKIFRSYTQYYYNNNVAQDISVSTSPQYGPRNLVAGSDELGPGSIDFRVWSANGGVIVRTQKYDDVKDRHRYNMYVIPEGENLQDNISKIVTMEYLTR